MDTDASIKRDWLSLTLIGYLADPSVAVVLLTGEPGVGKTVELQHLLSEHPRWLRYFVRQGSTMPAASGNAVPFLISIGHQLAALYPEAFSPKNLEIIVEQRVQSILPGGTVTAIRVEDLAASPFWQTAVRAQQQAGDVMGSLDALVVRHLTADPRLLSPETVAHMALIDPAASLMRLLPDETITIAVDGVDEVDRSTDVKILRWLMSIQHRLRNVKFLISSRPTLDTEQLCKVFGPSLRHLHLSGSLPQVQEDVKRLISLHLSAGNLESVLKLPANRRDEWTDALSEKAAGNLLYVTAYCRTALHFRDYHTPEMGFDLLNIVPAGLHDLYGFFLDRLHAELLGSTVPIPGSRQADEHRVDAWTELYQPILGVLAVAKEPLSAPQIHRLSAVSTSVRWVISALARLGPFTESVDGKISLYHSSLATFLTSEETLERVPSAYVGEQEWHQRIVRAYRGKASSWNVVDWTQLDNYGLLHVAEHLADSDTAPNILEEFNSLLCQTFWRESQKRFGTDYAFTHAATLALQASALVENEVTFFAKAAMILARASTRNYAVNEELTVALGAAGATRRAMEIIALNPDPAERVAAYASLSVALCEAGEHALAETCVKEGRTSLRLIEHEGVRRYRAVWLARPMMRLGLLRKMLVPALRDFENPEERDDAQHDIFRELLKRKRWREALTIARLLRNQRLRADAFSRLALALARSNHCTRALLVVRHAVDSAAPVRGDVFVSSLVRCARVFHIAKAPDHIELMDSAFGSARSAGPDPVFRDDSNKASMLAVVAVHSLALGRQDLFAKICAEAENISDEYRPIVLHALATAAIKKRDWHRAGQQVSALLDVLETLPASDYFTRQLIPLIRNSARVAAVLRNRELIERVLKIVNFTKEDGLRDFADVRIKCVSGFMKGGAPWAARKLLRSVRGSSWRDEILREFAVGLARRKNSDAAIKTLESIRPSYRAATARQLIRFTGTAERARRELRSVLLALGQSDHGFELEIILYACIDGLDSDFEPAVPTLVSACDRLDDRGRAEILARIAMKLVSLGKREMALDLVQREILSIQVRAGTSIFNDEIVLTLNIAAGLAGNREPDLGAELVMRDEMTPVRPEALAAVGVAAIGEYPNLAVHLVKKALSIAQNEADLYLRAEAYSKVGVQLSKSSDQFASLLKDVADLTRDAALELSEISDRDDFLAKAIVLYAEAGELETAFQLLSNLSSEWEQSGLRLEIALARARAGDFAGMIDNVHHLSGVVLLTTIFKGIAILYDVVGRQERFREQIEALAGAVDQHVEELRQSADRFRSETQAKYTIEEGHSGFAEVLAEHLTTSEVNRHFATAVEAYGALALACHKGGFLGAAQHFLTSGFTLAREIKGNAEEMDRAVLGLVPGIVATEAVTDWASYQRQVLSLLSIPGSRSQKMVRVERLHDFTYSLSPESGVLRAFVNECCEQQKYQSGWSVWRSGFRETVATAPTAVYEWLIVGSPLMAKLQMADTLKGLDAAVLQARRWYN